MEGEFNSPERRNNLHRVNKDEDDTEAVDLVLFIRNRIESIIYDN